MHMTQLFSQTRRKNTDSRESASAEYLVRAGYIRQLASGIYSYLPLALRVIRKLEEIIREEMNAIGGQEILMPVVNPAEIWQESARWYQIDAEMGRFEDRSGRDMVLAMTHEEVVADLVRNEIHSYRQLPSLIYHIQTKWRDDPRPRAGLIRVREFTMKDSYSLDLDAEGMKKQYQAHYDAYGKIFARAGLPVAVVGSDLGMMGGSEAHEFMYLTDIGEDTIITCPSCGYSANRQIAAAGIKAACTDDKKEIEKIHTPGCKTIADLGEFLGIPVTGLAKAVFMMATVVEGAGEGAGEGDGTVERFVLAVIRGDLEVNEFKVKNALGAISLRPADDEEIRARGIEPGYGSPIGADDAFVLIDPSIEIEANLVAGANSPEYHLKNVNYPRDFKADLVADISYAEAGLSCRSCGAPLQASRAVELGNIFQLGTRYSDAMKCTYLDNEGNRRPVFMGSYGIGVGRLLASIVEEYNDEHGIIWPPQVAPFPVHLVNLLPENEYTDELAASLSALGVDVLYDDRGERAGVKFNDADLIGIPLRVTVGSRGLSEGILEAKLRWEDSKRSLPAATAAPAIADLAGNLEDLFRQRFPLES